MIENNYIKFPINNMNIFNKKYWTDIFSFGDEYNNIKDTNTRYKLQMEDICKNNKINLG